MNIYTNFPFECCDSCQECILQVDVHDAYNNNKFVHKVMDVGCKNASLCMRLEKMNNERKAKVESDNGN